MPDSISSYMDLKLYASKSMFQLFHAGKMGFYAVRQSLCQFLFRDTNRFADILQSVFCHNFVFVLAQQKSYGRSITIAFHLPVNGGHIKTQLPKMFRFDFAGFQFDHHIAMKFEMIPLISFFSLIFLYTRHPTFSTNHYQKSILSFFANRVHLYKNR